MLCERCLEELGRTEAAAGALWHDVPDLTREEMRLAVILLARPRFVSRDTLMHLLYEHRADPPTETTLNVHLSRIRKKLPRSFRLISKRGEGWRLERLNSPTEELQAQAPF